MDYTIQYLISDNFALDGGAMFGVVPKTIWANAIPPDEQNRIPLACRLMILKGRGRTILIDAGVGDKWGEKERGIYSIQNLKLLSGLQDEITDVVITHLHFDHVGGLTYLDAAGISQLRFPNARHFIPKRNYEHALSPGLRERASYLSQNLAPLEHANLILTSDGDEIIPGITVHESNGHTIGLQWILIKNKDETYAYPSDLIPTHHHIPIPYVMGYDLCATTSMKEKEDFLKRAVAENWKVIFEHDRELEIGQIVHSNGKYKLA
jgi:glyoxylase-like metal-dependent hydrolase (beta-lactamase superfamily II)